MLKFLLILLISIKASAAIIYPDFDTAMLRKGTYVENHKDNYEKNKKRYESANKKFVALFKDIYLRNIEKAQQFELNAQVRIPRIIHQIWLGSKVPEKYFAWMSTWANMNGWQYMLWTDDNVESIKLYNQDIYDLTRNYAEKSDILRLELLYKYGGVYADLDYECLRPEIFEELHRSYDFYIGFEPVEHGFIGKFNLFKFCNALIGSKPGNQLVKDLIVNMKASYYAYKRSWGPLERTGPSYVTRIICEYEKSGAHTDRNIYLPCTFFYPYSEPELDYLSREPTFVLRIVPETAGIHYWSGSWWRNSFISYNINFEMMEQ